MFAVSFILFISNRRCTFFAFKQSSQCVYFMHFNAGKWDEKSNVNQFQAWNLIFTLVSTEKTVRETVSYGADV